MLVEFDQIHNTIHKNKQ